MKRRQLLAGGLGLALCGVAPGAHAIGAQQLIKLRRLRHDGNWDVHETATEALAAEVQFRTSITLQGTHEPVRAGDARLVDQGLLILAGDRAFSLGRTERERLTQWLELGGLMIVDNSGREKASEAFDASVREELGRMFPSRRLERVSPDHVMYRSFYRLDYPAGRTIRKSYVEGLALGRRFAVIYTQNDLLGAFASHASGGFMHSPTPGGESQREMAIRFGVNLLMYALCLHYKDDQVHLDYLLHKRKWKIRAPGR